MVRGVRSTVRSVLCQSCIAIGPRDQPERACPDTLLARWPRIDETSHVAGRLVKACQKKREQARRETAPPWYGGASCATAASSPAHETSRSERFSTILSRWPRIDDTGHVAGRLVKACQRNHETRGHGGKGHRHGTGCAKHCQERLLPQLHRHRPTRPAGASASPRSSRDGLASTIPVMWRGGS